MKQKDGKRDRPINPAKDLAKPVLANESDGVEGNDERRRYQQARDVFEYAFAMLEPMLDPDAGWQGRSLHHVSFNLVSENFPHLGHDEIHALLDAVKRVFVERSLSGDANFAPAGSAG